MSAVGTVAVVTVVHGRHDHLRHQQRSLARGRRRPEAWVVVAMQDPAVRDVLAEGQHETGLAADVADLPADPGALPLAAARNRGMSRALARGAEVLVGLDVDCLAGPDLVAGYGSAVTGAPDRLWAGPVTYLDPPQPGGYPIDDLASLDAPHGARPAPATGERVDGGDLRLFWSLSFALSARAWRRTDGFDEAYVGYGGEDTDFARRAGAAGLRMAWTGDARAYHQHHPVSRPPGGAPRRHPAQRPPLPRPVGRVADAGLARRVLRARPGRPAG
ncbi:glycosyltransferase family 2 protein [Nocardioides sp. J54]|uniref:glycosyltransferase family 2 protein n=1 Tax=Nocardioides sp. J54 TaxID=935866 RepID=UPI0004AD6885|nr:galactosyltransferase-related protein [Nocardioides sp. J54]